MSASRDLTLLGIIMFVGARSSACSLNDNETLETKLNLPLKVMTIAGETHCTADLSLISATMDVTPTSHSKKDAYTITTFVLREWKEIACSPTQSTLYNTMRKMHKG